MIKKREETVYVDVYYCDICKTELDNKKAEISCTIEFNFGYLSNELDGTSGKITLCQICGAEFLKELLKKFMPHEILLNQIYPKD